MRVQALYEAGGERLEQDSILHGVMTNYAFRVYDWKWLNAQSCALNTSAGAKILRLDRDARLVAARGQLLDELAAARFRRTPRHIRTIYGDAHVLERGYVCTVSDDMKNAALSRTRDDVAAAADNLGCLHAALSEVTCQHLFPEPGARVSEMIGSALASLDDGRVLCRNASSAFSDLLCANIDKVQHKAYLAQSLMDSAGLDARERSGQSKHSLSFGAYGLDRLAWTQWNRVATLDFGDLRRADSEWDLYTFCRELYVKGMNDWIPEALSVYGERMGPSEDRNRRAMAYAAFPFAVSGLVGEYQRSRQKEHPGWSAALYEALTLDGGAGRE